MWWMAALAVVGFAIGFLVRRWQLLVAIAALWVALTGFSAINEGRLNLTYAFWAGWFWALVAIAPLGIAAGLGITLGRAVRTRQTPPPPPATAQLGAPGSPRPPS